MRRRRSALVLLVALSPIGSAALSRTQARADLCDVVLEVASVFIPPFCPTAGCELTTVGPVNVWTC